VNEVDIASRLGLLLARPGMLIVAAPMFGGRFAPAQVRVGLSLIVAFILLPVVRVPDVTTTTALGVVMLREAAIGLALALAVSALVAGAQLGGQLTGSQLMLSYGSVIDPQGGVRNGVLGNVYGNLALLTFFLINGHHALLRGLTASYTAIPIGIGGVDDSLVRSITELLGLVFVLGLRLAAPVIVVMLILEVATGLIARAAPAFNPMASATPVRLIVGLLAVSALIPVVPGLVRRFAPMVIELGLRIAQAFR
jgi:flagellar biosynthetic protein FliR